MAQIERDGIAVLLSAAKGLDDRVGALARAPGFLGASVFRPVGFSGETLAYTRWRDWQAADDALDSGDGATLRATPIEAISVRLKASPGDHDGVLALDTPGMVVLVVRMAVDPEGSDALVDRLRSFTDAVLPAFAPVRAVAFHRSRDRTLVAEVLQVTGALALAMLQVREKRLRHHQRAVGALTRSETHGLLRLARTVQPDLAAR